ncbi:MAG: DUF3616 domain-containing protein [Candidatus Thiodiazotropha sp.]
MKRAGRGGLRTSLQLMVLLSMPLSSVFADGLTSADSVRVSGTLFADHDISAIEQVAGSLFVAADEGRDLQRLSGNPATGYRLQATYGLKNGKPVKKPSKGDEYDIEAMAFDGERYLYLVGSHSAKRRLLDAQAKGSRGEGLKQLEPIRSEKARRIMLRLSLDEEGNPQGKPETISLWKSINRSSLLKPFTKLPSKENGIDIEGLAYADGLLYVGFRGPVLRDNWVPVLVGDFDSFEKRHELKFIRLDGLGIRSMLALGRQGFLILAGPVGDGPGGFHLYLWNGRDQLPGQDGERGKVRHLGEIPVERGYKGEAMTLISQQGNRIELLIAFDGGKNGALRHFKLVL